MTVAFATYLVEVTLINKLYIMNANERIFSVVKKQIDDFDTCGLLACGCPSDEFDNESKLICERLNSSMSVQQIAAVIASILNSYFEESYDPQRFTQATQEIKGALDSIYS